MRRILLICLLLVGCTTTQYVPTEVTKIEYKNKEIVDSIYIRDSILIREKSDTVFLEKYRFVFKDKVLKDTIVRIDSIPVIHTVEKIVEVNKLKKWQIILMVLGGVLLGIIGYKLLRIVKV